MGATKGGEDAAMKIQAVQKGKRTRTNAKKRTQALNVLQKSVRRWQARKRDGQCNFASVVKQVRQRYAAWCDMFEEAVQENANTSELLTVQQFVKLARDVNPELAVAQAEALWGGYTTATRQAGVDLKGFCCILEAVNLGDAYAYEYAGLSQEEYAVLAGRADITLWRHAVFEDLRSPDAAGLDKTQLKQALQRVGCRFSDAQLDLLVNGYFVGTGLSNIEFEDLALLLEAAVTCDWDAAEFAQVPVEEFRARATA